MTRPRDDVSVFWSITSCRFFEGLPVYFFLKYATFFMNLNTILKPTIFDVYFPGEFHGSVWLARASGWLMIFTLKIGCSRESVVFQLQIQKVKSVQIEFQTSTNKFPTTIHYISLYRYYILFLVIYSSMVFLSSSSSLLSKSYMNVIGGETYFRNTIFKLTLNSLRQV